MIHRNKVAETVIKFPGMELLGSTVRLITNALKCDLRSLVATPEQQGLSETVERQREREKREREKPTHAQRCPMRHGESGKFPWAAEQ